MIYDIFSKILSSIDFFPLLPSTRITYNRQEFYSSYYSKSMSIFLIILSFLSFFYFGDNMIFKKNPDISVSEYYRSSPDNIKLTGDIFFFYFGLLHNNQHIIDETIYKPEITLIKEDNNQIVRIPIETQPCTKSEIISETNVQLTDQIYCIKNYNLMEMEGSPDSTKYKYINIKIKMCQNSSCQPSKKIEEIINNAKVWYTYSSYLVDSRNYDNPFVKIGVTSDIPISPFSISELSSSFQLMEMETDDGSILENKYSNKVLTNINERILIKSKNEDDMTVLECDLKLDKIVKRYTRNYEKIQSVIAKTGGAIKILIMVLFFFVKPIATLGFQQDLCNDIFTYEVPEMTVKGEQMKQRKLNINLFEYLWSFIIEKGNAGLKRKNIEIANEILNKNLDISHILNKLVEIEKLKFILLDKTQLTVFDFMPKPIISLNSKDKRKLSKKSVISNNLWNDTFFEQSYHGANPLINSYERLKKRPNKSETDLKLIKSIENENEKLFKRRKNMGMEEGDSNLTFRNITSRKKRSIRNTILKIFSFWTPNPNVNIRT